ncbi:aspartyl-phosphate phosphatase Spo0E family protein [Halobacillus salinarum]|uniref:Aspartyl-phosphate phosphatase Spo0E family protein n=1 Tax=Halobacillus salinarum TaxID=2932257 RepID=A0ABY4EFZ4_9BACI|nr:aspartyl-phosphate phosphatase Spo0E family protein [Halobacillus salinarum]UOQ42972.1 aspartyl-phosphate phosphatase Spo0E family protein [Halobacillus salinarum]
MNRTCLEKQIEKTRIKMYEAYNNAEQYDVVLKISQELDGLLNRLQNLSTKRSKPPE